MSYNLKTSLTTIFLISLILVINLIVALAANRETVKRSSDDQDDEWIKQKPVMDLTYNSGLDDNSLERLMALVSSHSREGGRWPFEKRQYRYHQCYFNPISCFRRRK